MLDIHELMTRSEPHINIVNAWAKAWDLLGGRFFHPACSVSGGADSDICGQFSVFPEGGCWSCKSCGWSKCNTRR